MTVENSGHTASAPRPREMASIEEMMRVFGHTDLIRKGSRSDYVTASIWEDYIEVPEHVLERIRQALLTPAPHPQPLPSQPAERDDRRAEVYLVSALVERPGKMGHRAHVASFGSKEEAIGASLELWQTDGWSVTSYDCTRCDKLMGNHVPQPHPPRQPVDAWKEEIAKLRERLQFDPGGGDKIDELEGAVEHLRFQIDTLTAEREAAFAMSRCECEVNEACRNLTALTADRDRLKGRVEELQKALEPFARWPGDSDKMTGYEAVWTVTFHSKEKQSLIVRHFRAARQALKGEQA